MKSAYYILWYLVLATGVLQTSCDKQGNETASAASTTAGAGGSLARFAITGNYLYIVDYANLEVYDLASPATPVFKSTQNIGFNIETIYPYKDKLFIGSSNGMYVYSITDPAKPVKEGAITHVRACDPVVANDTVAYVTLRQGVTCGGNQSILNIYDVKTSTAPKLIKTVDLKSPYGLGIRQKALYICEGANGMSIFNLADPYNPQKVAELKDDTYYDVIPYGNILIAYIGKGVSFFDITDPLNIVKAGTVNN